MTQKKHHAITVVIDLLLVILNVFAIKSGNQNMIENSKRITKKRGLLKTLLDTICKLIMPLKKEPDGEREADTSEEVYTWDYSYAVVDGNNIVFKRYRSTTG